MGQVPSSSVIDAARHIPPPKATPTPYLVQELFVTRNCRNCEGGLVALAPPHAKPTLVDPSFFQSADGSASNIISNDSADLFAAIVPCNSTYNNCVAEFAPPYTKAPVAVITSGLNFDGCFIFSCLALDDNQNLYVVSSVEYSLGSNTVNEYASPYDGAPVAILQPQKGIAIHPEGGIATYKSDLFDLLTVCKLQASGQCNGFDYESYVNGYNAPPKWGKQFAHLEVGGIDGCDKGFNRDSSCFPYDAAFDSSGDLFISWGPNGHGTGFGLVTEWASPYKKKPKVIITSDINQPRAIALDSKGDLFVMNANQGNQQNITEYAPPYKANPTVISNGIGIDDDLGMIVVDGSGDLFLSDYGHVGSGSGGAILEYEPPYTKSPIEITAGLSNFAPTFLALGPAKSSKSKAK
jgi:hypothetical protein